MLLGASKEKGTANIRFASVDILRVYTALL